MGAALGISAGHGYFLDAFAVSVRRWPARCAYWTSVGERLSYAQLNAQSTALACALLKRPLAPRAPILVYGHKAALMPVCLLACVKSGHPYIAADTAFPLGRIQAILAQTGRIAVLNTTDEDLCALAPQAGEIIGRSELFALCEPAAAQARAVASDAASPLPSSGFCESTQGKNEPVSAPAPHAADGSGTSAPHAAGGSAPVPDLPYLTPDAADGSALAPDLPYLAPDDLFYILFTSGSTGTPKGIEITRSCVDSFCRWMCAEYPAEAFPSQAAPASEPGEDPAATANAECPHGQQAALTPPVTCENTAAAPENPQAIPWPSFNKAPFSFDVSLTDFAPGLAQGETLCALDETHETSMAATFAALAEWNPARFIATPSFADLCLADPAFSQQLCPQLHTFLLAGETLRPATAAALFARFPGCRIINGYGPTESTDLITIAEITPAQAQAGQPLPIGRPKPGARLYVLDPQTLAPLPDGQPGELFIVSDTVAAGYYQLPQLTAAAFHSCPAALAQGEKSFRTGDEAVRTADGTFYYRGRLDLQVKLHGYRIELGDIEARLAALPAVAQACVLPVHRNGSLSHLCACIVCSSAAQESSGFALTRQLKAQLRDVLPAYMVPRSFKYFAAFPLNASGKTDRKQLARLLEE